MLMTRLEVNVIFGPGSEALLCVTGGGWWGGGALVGSKINGTRALSLFPRSASDPTAAFLWEIWGPRVHTQRALREEEERVSHLPVHPTGLDATPAMKHQHSCGQRMGLL